MTLRSIAVFGTLLFGGLTCAMAGGGSVGGGAQIAPMDSGSVSTYKSTATAPGSNAWDSAGGSASQSGSSSTAGPSSFGGSAGTTNDTSAASSSASSSSTSNAFSGPTGASDGQSRRSRDPNDASIEIATRDEKVIDTGDKAVAAGKTAKVESTDKVFSSHLLDSVGDIANLGAQKDQDANSKDKDTGLNEKPAKPADKDDSKKKE